MAKVTVKQEAGNEIATEVIASAIVTISEAMKKIKSGRLNDSALLTLVAAGCYPKVPRDQVATVLRSINSLEQRWLKPKK